MGDEPADAALPSPLVELDDDRLSSHGVRLWLKRDDLIHPALPGNKWRKLLPNVRAAREQGRQRLLTFGGAWSNHIRATAAAGRLFGFDTIGVIRGEEHLPLNPVLTAAVADGMRLAYLDRSTYRHKHTPEITDRLHDDYGDFYLLPEGGSNTLAVRSCREIPTEIDIPFDVICCAVGTGGTLAGIAAGLTPNQQALGFSALKGGEFLIHEVERLQVAAFGARSGTWNVECRYHFGGYAKRTPALDAFITDFTARHALTLDWIYEAKMLSALLDLTRHNTFPTNTRLIAVIAG